MCADGHPVHYDRLLLATGASPRHLSEAQSILERGEPIAVDRDRAFRQMCVAASLEEQRDTPLASAEQRGRQRIHAATRARRARGEARQIELGVGASHTQQP